MNTVTIEFTNSRNRKETATFDIFAKSEKADFRARRANVFGSGMVAGEDWDDEEIAAVEKDAAQEVGIEFGKRFYFIRTA